MESIRTMAQPLMIVTYTSLMWIKGKQGEINDVNIEKNLMQEHPLLTLLLTILSSIAVYCTQDTFITLAVLISLYMAVMDWSTFKCSLELTNILMALAIIYSILTTGKEISNLYILLCVVGISNIALSYKTEDMMDKNNSGMVTGILAVIVVTVGVAISATAYYSGILTGSLLILSIYSAYTIISVKYESFLSTGAGDFLYLMAMSVMFGPLTMALLVSGASFPLLVYIIHGTTKNRSKRKKDESAISGTEVEIKVSTLEKFKKGYRDLNLDMRIRTALIPHFHIGLCTAMIIIEYMTKY